MSRRQALFGILACILPGSATAQGFTIRKASRNEIGFQFAQIRFGAQGGGGARQQLYHEWLRLGFEGVVIDPSVIDFRFTLNPTLNQTQQSLPHDLPNRSQAALGVDLGVGVFRSGVLSATLNWSQANGNERSSFGSEIESRSSNLGAAIWYRNPLLPTQLDFRRTTRRRVWLDGAPEIWEDIAVERMRLSAKNRKTSILLERNESTNRFSGRVLTTNVGEVAHSTKWGKGSSSRSTIRYVQGTRSAGSSLIVTGADDYRHASWTERLRLQHTARIVSDYMFRKSWGRSNGRATGEQFISAAASTRISSQLNATVPFTSRSTSVDGGSVNVLTLLPRVVFGTAISRRASVSASVSIGYERRRSDPTGDGWANVVDERHIVGPSGRLSLMNPWADEASVSVMDAGRSVVYDVGVDYWLAASLPVLDIVIPPTGRITAGDTVLVSYRYQVFPDAQSDALRADYGATLRIQGLRVYFRRSVSATGGAGGGVANQASAAGFFLDDRDDQVMGISVGKAIGFGDVQILAQRRQIEHAAYRSTAYELRSTLGVDFPKGIHGAFGGSLSRTTNSAGRIDRMLSVTSAMTWVPVRTLRLAGTLGVWRWAQNERESRTLGGGLNAEWNVGLTSIVLRFSRNTWDNAGKRSSNSRFSAYLSRSF
jgi:hypothetical protein